jgi:hypothetical protein
VIMIECLLRSVFKIDVKRVFLSRCRMVREADDRT